MLIAVNHHYVRQHFGGPLSGIRGLTPDEFARRLRILARAGTFVGASEVLAALDGQRSLPDRAILITFDDGLREQFESAWPILKEMGVPALFFVNPGPIRNRTVSLVHKIHLLRDLLPPAEFEAALQDASAANGIDLGAPVDPGLAASQYRYDPPEIARLKYLLNIQLQPEQLLRLMHAVFSSHFPMSEAEASRQLYMQVEHLRELAEQDCIGSHADEHLPLGTLPAEEIHRQLEGASAWLAATTGTRPSAMSYPFGSRVACGGPTAAAASRAGIRFAFTMERAANPTLDDPLFLARFDTNDLPGAPTSPWLPETLFTSVPMRTWRSEVE